MTILDRPPRPSTHEAFNSNSDNKYAPPADCACLPAAGDGDDQREEGNRPPGAPVGAARLHGDVARSRDGRPARHPLDLDAPARKQLDQLELPHDRLLARRWNSRRPVVVFPVRPTIRLRSPETSFLEALRRCNTGATGHWLEISLTGFHPNRSSRLLYPAAARSSTSCTPAAATSRPRIPRPFRARNGDDGHHVDDPLPGQMRAAPPQRQGRPDPDRSPAEQVAGRAARVDLRARPCASRSSSCPWGGRR